MLALNLSEYENITVSTVQHVLHDMEEHENRAIILHKGLWYLYSEDSVVLLSEYNEDYHNLISYSRKPCSLRMVDSIPSENSCRKNYKYSQYLYSSNQDFLYYWDVKSETLTAIQKNLRSNHSGYNPHQLIKHLRNGSSMVRQDGQDVILQLRHEQLAYITKHTGHAWSKCIHLTKQQERSVNNRINNEKLGSTLNWSSFWSGMGGLSTGALLGWLVIAPALSLATAPSIVISAICLGIFCLAAAALIGRLYAYCTGKYKPIDDIIYQSPDDDIGGTSHMLEQLNLYHTPSNSNNIVVMQEPQQILQTHVVMHEVQQPHLVVHEIQQVQQVQQVQQPTTYMTYNNHPNYHQFMHHPQSSSPLPVSNTTTNYHSTNIRHSTG